MSEIDAIHHRCQIIIEACQGQSRINPSWVATGMYNAFDPQHVAPPEVRVGCHLHFRQVARSFLRKKYAQSSPEEDVSIQHELFPQLQKRYPVAHTDLNADSEYVLFEDMTEEDYDWNIMRLEKEATAKQAHADALRNARNQRFGQAA